MILNKRLFFIVIILIIPFALFAQPKEPAEGWSIYPKPTPNTLEYTFYVGDGVGKTLEEAKQSASMDLKRSVAESIETNTSVDSYQIEHMEESYKYRGQDSYSIADYTTSSYSNVKVYGLTEVYWEGIDSPDDDGFWRVSVLGYISASDKKKSEEETKVWQQKEEQPYQIYKSIQALFKQVGKEKEFMSEIPASYATWLKDKCLVLKNLDDKKNSDWPGLFSDFLKKLFRNPICTNINIGDEPACVVYNYSYTERIKSTLKRNGIKCIQNGNVLNICPENESAFRYFVSTMKNPSRISLYVTQGYNIDSDIYSKSLDELLTKTFTDILTKKDRELKCEIRSEKFSQEDFARHDTRYAIVLELNFTYTKREKKYIDEKQMYNLNFGITAKFFDSVNPEKFLMIGKIEKSYLADSSKFKPKAPDKDFILTKAKDAVNFLSKTGGENNLTTLVDEFLKQI